MEASQQFKVVNVKRVHTCHGASVGLSVFNFLGLTELFSPHEEHPLLNGMGGHLQLTKEPRKSKVSEYDQPSAVQGFTLLSSKAFHSPWTKKEL